jgi:arylsulfatase A-like enzyme
MRIMIGVVALFAAMGCGAVGAEARRPNVLWIVADDHAAYVTGCYGNPVVRTPNIDRLASTGVRFDRAYCNSPVCTASRQSFLTGRYPRTVGVTLLTTPFPEEELTLADLLGAAGYETASFGKMHFNNTLKHGFEHRLDLPDWNRALQARGRTPLPDGTEVLPPWKPFRDPASVWLNSMALPYLPAADMPSTFLADAAVEFLSTTRDKPFFLMVSFPEPHSPFHFPVEYRGKYDPAQMPVGTVGPEDEDQIPDIFRALTHKEKQGIVASYYASTEWLDHNVGRVLEALEASGQADETIVVYVGDHGYSLGHHGRFEKHCSYEPAVRSPLIVRYPPAVKGGRSTSALVELVDILPTVLQWCEVDVPATVQGRSLVPVLSGQTDRHRQQVFASYAHNEEAMVSDGRWKLVYYRGRRVRDDGYDPRRPLAGPVVKLFDLKNDPDEMTNLAARPEHAARVRAMTAQLADHLRQTARQPERVPTGDPMTVLDHCVQPDDVAAPRR